MGGDEMEEIVVSLAGKKWEIEKHVWVREFRMTMATAEHWLQRAYGSDTRWHVVASRKWWWYVIGQPLWMQEIPPQSQKAEGNVPQ